MSGNRDNSKREVANFRRFYASFNRLPCMGDREELKRQIVSEYTWGRTDSLREMSRGEYDACCEGLEKLTGRKDELRRRRSACLRLMQRLGVDTTDWARIDNFCRHPRIAGKPFARIGLEELETLSVKLRAIERKGGLRQRRDAREPGGIAYVFIGPDAPEC